MSESGPRDHWDAVFEGKGDTEVAWYRPRLEVSLEHLARIANDRAAAIVDVGCGVSTFVDDLLALGYSDITLLDVSAEALARVRDRLGCTSPPVSSPRVRTGLIESPPGPLIDFMRADVTRAELPLDRFDVWHDRAVFHFLTDEADRARYVANLSRSLRPGGHAMIATFGPDGPTRCSGLNAARYDVRELGAALGRAFVPLDSTITDHVSPKGNRQQFLHALFQYSE